jgi:hypothetical protein
MSDIGGTLPRKFPLPPLDRKGGVLARGDKVLVLTVESCAHDLLAEDQARLRSVVGQIRTVIEFDESGFVWLDSEPEDNSANFCLFPDDVERA